MRAGNKNGCIIHRIDKKWRKRRSQLLARDYIMDLEILAAIGRAGNLPVSRGKDVGRVRRSSDISDCINFLDVRWTDVADRPKETGRSGPPYSVLSTQVGSEKLSPAQQ